MKAWWNSITREQCRDGIYTSLGSLLVLGMYLVIIYVVAPKP